MQHHHDKRAHTLPPLNPGQRVRFQKEPQGPRVPAEVIERANEPRSYMFQTPNGHVRQNRVLIREAPIRTPQYTIEQEPIYMELSWVPPAHSIPKPNQRQEGYTTRQCRTIRLPASFRN